MASSIEIEEISVIAKVGASRDVCIKEGMLLAVKEWQDVDFIFNGKHYIISPNKWFETIVY